MKKQILLTTLILSAFFSFGQLKPQIGVYTEGSWFLPKNITPNIKTKDRSFSAGGGLYVSNSIAGRFSASIGAGYRYKTNKATFLVLPDGGESGGVYGSPDDYGYETHEREFPQHYFVVPVKVRYTNTRHLFLESGVEATWLLNYKYVSEKPEYNWLVGIGCSKYRLQGSVSYVIGLKDQGMGKIQDTDATGQSYRNQMLIVNLSYPILWKRNK